MEDVFHFQSVITKKKRICPAFRWLHFVDQNLFAHPLFSIMCTLHHSRDYMVNRRVKCKYRHEVSHKKKL